MEITKVKEVVGQDIADELKLVQFVDGKSTTNTIKRIQENENAIIKEFLAHQETIAKVIETNARTSFRSFKTCSWNFKSRK